jgi:DNA-binding GntR family transcriptional regulator
MTSSDTGPLTLPSLRDEVYALIRRRILAREYPPNYRFNLSRLEETLGISRTPLKEALHRLAAEGLVEIRPRRGTYVTCIDPEDVAESFDVRAILECAAAEIFVETATDAEIAGLRALNTEMNALLEQPDFQAALPAYLELDRELHRRFIALTHNRRLASIYGQIDTHLQIARLQRKFHRLDSQATRQEHEAILRALENRDGPALRTAVQRHITMSKNRLLKALAVPEPDGESPTKDPPYLVEEG